MRQRSCRSCTSSSLRRLCSIRVSKSATPASSSIRPRRSRLLIETIRVTSPCITTLLPSGSMRNRRSWVCSCCRLQGSPSELYVLLYEPPGITRSLRVTVHSLASAWIQGPSSGGSMPSSAASGCQSLRSKRTLTVVSADFPALSMPLLTRSGKRSARMPRLLARPRQNRTPSRILLFPEPFGPVTTVKPVSRGMVIAPPKDLKWVSPT